MDRAALDVRLGDPKCCDNHIAKHLWSGPMKILYVIAMYGPEYLANLIHREIGLEFVKRRHSFSVFALASARELSRPDTLQTPDRLSCDKLRRQTCQVSNEDGIAVHRALAAGRPFPDALNAVAKPLFHYDRFGAGWWYLSRYLAQHRDFDVILAEGAYPFGAMTALALYSLSAQKASGAPKLVITVAGGDFIASRETRYGYGRFRTARALMRYAFERAAAVRVTTPLVRERVLALGASPEQIALLPRNIASYSFPPNDIPLETYRVQAGDKIRAQWNLGTAHVIAAVGRLLPIKGFDTLLRALPRIVERAGDTRVLLIGPNRVDPQHGDYQKYLMRLADELHVADRVIFTGAVPHPDMRDYLAACDVIAVPSVLEGMNKIAVEGAAVGTPSVVTRTAGIADWVNETRCGVVVSEASPDALAEGLIRLLCDDSLRADMARHGVEAAGAFSSEKIGGKLVELCERVVGGS